MGHRSVAWLARGRSRACPGSGLGMALVVMLATLTVAAPAGAADCPFEAPDPTLTFRATLEQARLDHTKTSAEILALSNGLRHHSSTAQPGITVGTTITYDQPAVRFEVHIAYTKLRDGRYCTTLRSVDAQFKQPQPIIYVSSEYPKGSCNYNVIYEHEKQHLRIHVRTFRIYAPQIKRALLTLMHGFEPRVVNDPQDALDWYLKRLNEGARPLLDEMEADRVRRNAALDSPENYARENAKCSSW